MKISPALLLVLLSTNQSFFARGQGGCQDKSCCLSSVNLLLGDGYIATDAGCPCVVGGETVTTPAPDPNVTIAGGCSVAPGANCDPCSFTIPSDGIQYLIVCDPATECPATTAPAQGPSTAEPESSTTSGAAVRSAASAVMAVVVAMW